MKYEKPQAVAFVSVKAIESGSGQKPSTFNPDSSSTDHRLTVQAYEADE